MQFSVGQIVKTKSKEDIYMAGTGLYFSESGMSRYCEKSYKILYIRRDGLIGLDLGKEEHDTKGWVWHSKWLVPTVVDNRKILEEDE